MGTDIEADPVTGLVLNFSPMSAMAPPPLGSEISVLGGKELGLVLSGLPDGLLVRMDKKLLLTIACDRHGISVALAGQGFVFVTGPNREKTVICLDTNRPFTTTNHPV